MKSFAEFVMEKRPDLAPFTSKGTYGAVRFDDPSKDAITQYMQSNDIPNAVPTDKLHSTLLYSRRHCPNYAPDPNVTYKGNVAGLEVWPTQSGKNALVAKMHAPDLVDRHNELMATHNATYDYPEFRPHFTMSYDVGDMDHTKLPPFTSPLAMNNEYAEDLDLKWKPK